MALFGCFSGKRTFSESAFSCTPKEITTPLPNPFKFEILKALEIVGDLVLIEVRYEDCTTFGGIKILLLESTNYDPKKIDILDPHFLEDNNIVARFKPTSRGMKLAYDLMEVERKNLHFWKGVCDEI